MSMLSIMLSSVREVSVPTPRSISYLYNFGSLVLGAMVVQVGSGLVLSFYYASDNSVSFYAVDLLSREFEKGLVIRLFHVWGASLVFLFLLFHMGRAILQYSFFKLKTWGSGVLMLMLVVASAFLGYVLPWGQMSYWGASVITNFFSVIPLVGKQVVEWLWGGFSVGSPTLMRFFSLHFLLPLVSLGGLGAHLVVLHIEGGSNPLGVGSGSFKLSLYPYFAVKDMITLVLGLGGMYLLLKGFPLSFLEAQNALEANPLVTPPHIQPEWYYLAAYAVLRSMPSKGGGVVSLVLFLVFILILPLLRSVGVMAQQHSVGGKLSTVLWFVNFFFLTWLGACVVEEPFISLAQVSGLGYFVYFLLV